MSLRLNLLGATTVASLMSFTHAASAGDYDGWYVGGGVGWNGLNHLHYTSSDPEDGWIGVGRVGYKPLDTPFRFELELNYKDNRLSDNTSAPTVNPLITTPLTVSEINAATDGHVTSWNLLANAIYDFQTGGPVLPYVGLGAGWSFMKARAHGPFINFNSSPSELVGQVIAGLGWRFAPHWNADLEYRYSNNLSAKISGTIDGLPTTAKDNFASNSVLVGLRYSWGISEAPPPSPPPMVSPPPPPPPAPTVFKIFFPFNQYRLTDDASKIVDEIASQYKGKPVDSIDIQGNTDSSGKPGYNMKLGDRRADAVKAELVRDGVPASIIHTESLGETNPAVKTGDNVREPLNRRAEVVIKLQDRGS